MSTSGRSPQPARRGAGRRRDIGCGAGRSPARRPTRWPTSARRRSPCGSTTGRWFRNCIWSRCTCCASTSTWNCPRYWDPRQRQAGGALRDGGRLCPGAGMGGMSCLVVVGDSLLDRDVDGQCRRLARTRRLRCWTRSPAWTGRAGRRSPRCSPPATGTEVSAGHRARRRCRRGAAGRAARRGRGDRLRRCARRPHPGEDPDARLRPGAAAAGPRRRRRRTARRRPARCGARRDRGTRRWSSPVTTGGGCPAAGAARGPRRRAARRWCGTRTRAARPRCPVRLVTPNEAEVRTLAGLGPDGPRLAAAARRASGCGSAGGPARWR